MNAEAHAVDQSHLDSKTWSRQHRPTVWKFVRVLGNVKATENNLLPFPNWSWEGIATVCSVRSVLSSLITRKALWAHFLEALCWHYTLCWLTLFGNVFTHVALNFNLHIFPRDQRGSVRVRLMKQKISVNAGLLRYQKKSKFKTFQARDTRESYLRSDFEGEFNFNERLTESKSAFKATGKTGPIDDYGSIPTGLHFLAATWNGHDSPER